jgi:hypothetical protein
MADIDTRIDALYQLPLDQFTPARNALAKELGNASIKALEKPNVAAWAVNQLYWRERALFDRLTKAAERLRSEHRKMLAGKSTDLRDVEGTHRGVVREAVDTIRGLLTEADQALSPATLGAVQETLEALPSEEFAGRLTRPLEPLGFEALSGVTIKPSLRIVAKSPVAAKVEREDAQPASAADRRKQRELAKQREKEEQERKERQRAAEKALKVAEAAMLGAEDAVKKAEKALAELRAARDEAVNEYQRARLRAHE